MELTQLRYFQTAAYYQHISRAAEELNRMDSGFFSGSTIS